MARKHHHRRRQSEAARRCTARRWQDEPGRPCSVFRQVTKITVTELGTGWVDLLRIGAKGAGRPFGTKGVLPDQFRPGFLPRWQEPAGNRRGGAVSAADRP
jgi:hypothetical protein